MKSKVIALLFSSLFVLSLFAEDGLFPNIKFNSKTGDVGIVTLDSLRHTVAFPFKNTGKSVLAITGSRVSCSCLTVKIPQDSIAPDSSGTIFVTYDATDRTEPERLYKSVYIYTNCEVPNVSLVVKGIYTASHDSVFVE